jgi:hypothetical protein
VHEKEAWWKVVVIGAGGALLIPQGRMGWLWEYIRKGWRLFSSHIKFDPGDGSKTRFWDDVWCGELSLNEAFPILYNIAHVKDTPIAVDLDCSSGSLQWNVSFIHLAHNWEVDMV